ncbi:MAG: hypothetical protein NZM26_00290 [Patescibacteria group bacterium]|nr:hypothetical protein [Patescibacteria group bacterium]
MATLSDILTGKKVLEKTNSKHNGEIAVIYDFAFGTYIKVGGLTQSGKLIKEIWATTIKKSKINNFSFKSGLLLGLGGGSVVHVWKRFWPEMEIVGVDIDAKMVEMGEKYMKLNTKEMEVIISDAFDAIVNLKLQCRVFDLIGVDLYFGDCYPDKFDNEEFPKLLKSLLVENGVVVFNRLYYGDKRPSSAKFGRILESVFNKVDVVYPEANVMFVCSN